jgi:uncharacterized protein YjbI with pentapeptide repeats
MCREVRMRSSAELVRNLSLSLKNLKQRSVQFWGSDRSRHARDWVTNRLKQADSRIREIRLARPGVFWAVTLGSIPFLIVFALFTSGNTDRAWPPLTTFGTALGASIVAIATFMRHFAQTEADRQRRIVETFSKAVEQLGSDKLEVRVGAIFALERISKESPDDYWTIMEVLAAFVRERVRYITIMARLPERAYFLWLQAGRPEGRSEEFWGEAVRLEGHLTDIDAIFTVIGRRSAENRQREKDRGWHFDLRGTYPSTLPSVFERGFLANAHLEGANLLEAHLEEDIFVNAHLEGAFLVNAHLEGANLLEAHLEEAIFVNAHLEGAFLVNAHLEGTNLWMAHFEGAHLWGAHLEQAVLQQAHLEGANLLEAHLEGADLRQAHLEGADLRKAHFEGANLWRAHLEGADLREAHFEGANLVGAHLEGADFSKAKGLTDDKLVLAHGDGKTKLPEGITRPKSWPPLVVGASPLVPF